MRLDPGGPGTESARRYRFADLAFDVGQRRLRRGGEEIALSKLTYELVRVLVEAAPNLVTHDELAERVWGPRRIVTPENLAKRVMMLRQALGDNAEEPRYIEGLRGQGYRLIPSVETDSPHAHNGAHASVGAAPSSSSSVSVFRPEHPERRSRRYATTAALSLLVVAVALVAWETWRAPETERVVMRLLLDVRPAEQLVGSAASPRPSRTAMALSPDGETVVFTAQREGILQLYRRRLEDNEAVPMAGTEGAHAPFFSPDGASVGFWADRKLRRVSLDGGPVVDIVGVDVFYGAAWGPDDTIVFSNGMGKGIARVAATGGSIETLITGGSHDMHVLPRMLPGGRAMLYTWLAEPYGKDETSVAVYRFDNGEQHTLVHDAADARFSRSGHLLFMRLGVLLAAPFDAERLTLTGDPVAVIDDVMQAVGAPNRADETRAGQFDVADNGTLVYLTGGIHPWDTSDAFWVDRAGLATHIPIEGPVEAPRVSPDGKRIAYMARRRAQSPPSDIWVYDIERQNSVRLTHEGINMWPVWSPDGKNLVFSQTVDGISSLALVAADGSARPVRLVMSTTAREFWPSSWSADSDTLVLVYPTPDDFEIWTLDMAPGNESKAANEPQRLLDGPSLDMHPALSTDGRWLAYASYDTGTSAVYVQRYPNGQRTRISSAAGIAPIWAPDATRLYYWQPTPPKQVIAVDFDGTGDVPVIGAPRVAFDPTEYHNGMPVRGWDLSPDGQMFAVIKDVPKESPVTLMHVVLNWTAELERRVPVD